MDGWMGCRLAFFLPPSPPYPKVASVGTCSLRAQDSGSHEAGLTQILCMYADGLPSYAGRNLAGWLAGSLLSFASLLRRSCCAPDASLLRHAIRYMWLVFIFLF